MKKKYLFYSILLFVFANMLVSCSKSDSDNGEEDTQWQDEVLEEDYAPSHLSYTIFSDGNDVTYKNESSVIDLSLSDASLGSPITLSGNYQKISKNKSSITYQFSINSIVYKYEYTLHFESEDKGIYVGTKTIAGDVTKARGIFSFKKYTNFAPSSVAGMVFINGTTSIYFDYSGSGCQFYDTGTSHSYSNCSYSYSANGSQARLNVSYIYGGLASRSRSYFLEFTYPNGGNASIDGYGEFSLTKR